MFLILSLIPIIVFFFYVQSYAVNVPFMDDMELVETINGLENNDAQLLSVLVRQQNDHRTAFSRLGILLTYWIKGTLDFRLTVVLGYLNLLLLGGAFFLVYRSSNKGYSWFLPVTMLLFSPIVYQDHLWSMTAYQYTLAIAFSILALFFLQKKKIRCWYWAFPLSIAATLTNLDGISLLPIVLFWLAAQKRWKHFFIYLIFTSIYLFIYFSNFKFSSASKLAFSPDGLYMMAQSFVALTGSIAKVISDTYGVVFSVAVGSIILITYLILKLISSASSTRFIKAEKNWLHFSLAEICFLKMLASIAMISVGRSADGVAGMMSIRFQIYSVSMLIVFYLSVIEKVQGKPLGVFRSLFLLLALALSITRYVKYAAAVKYYSSGLKADTYNYTEKGVFLHQYFNLPDPEPKFYRNYIFPVFFSDETIKVWRKGSDKSSGRIDLKVTGIENKGQYSHYLNSLLGFAVEADKFEPHSKGMFLCIFQKGSAQKPYIVAMMEQEGSLFQRLKGNKPPNRLHGDIPDKLPAGTYQANLCWMENEVARSLALSDSLIL